MTISASNIEIQSVHRIPKSVSEDFIKDAILIAYNESRRVYDFDVFVWISQRISLDFMDFV